MSAQASPSIQALLSDPHQAGVFQLPLNANSAFQITRMLAAAENAQQQVFRLSLATVSTREQLLSALGRAMHFPECFGHNLDALADCLGDMSWCPAEAYLLILEHCEGVCASATEDFLSVLQIFAESAAEWRARGVAFWCFVDVPVDGVLVWPALNQVQI